MERFLYTFKLEANMWIVFTTIQWFSNKWDAIKECKLYLTSIQN